VEPEKRLVAPVKPQQEKEEKKKEIDALQGWGAATVVGAATPRRTQSGEKKPKTLERIKGVGKRALVRLGVSNNVNIRENGEQDDDGLTMLCSGRHEKQDKRVEGTAEGFKIRRKGEGEDRGGEALKKGVKLGGRVVAN